MKRFRVIVTPEAQVGIRDAFNYIYAQAPLNAERWIRKLYAEIDTLERFPERCAYAREREYLEEDLRQLVFKSHRLVFYVDQSNDTVSVLAIRHGRQRAVGEPEEEDDR